MKTILIALVVSAALVWGQTSLAPPQAGYIQDGANSFRPVYGIAGNFLLGDPAAARVVSGAFSGSFAMLKTDSTLSVTDRLGQTIASQEAPQGPALFAFSANGSPALAYFPGSNLLLEWIGGGFQLVLFDWSAFPGTAVQSVALPDPAHAALIVQRGDGLWDFRVLLASGEIDAQTALPGVTAPALRLATGELIYADAQGFVIRHLDASETHVAAQVPASFSLAPMGDGWIQVRDLDSCAQLALRVTPGREAVYILPEVSQ